MQIILQEDVEKLGTRGEVVEVAPGYARNYLLPHKLALEASPANIKRLEKIRITLSKRTATEKSAAEQQAALLNDVTVKFARKAGETDQLFGSVTSADLADALLPLRAIPIAQRHFYAIGRTGFPLLFHSRALEKSSKSYSQVYIIFHRAEQC